MSEGVTIALIAALGAVGGVILNLLVKAVKWVIDWRRKSVPEKVKAERVHAAVAQADESLILVARARDIMSADADALREERARLAIEHREEVQGLRREMADMSARHAQDQRQWWLEKAELRKEIDELEDKLRATLDEVQALRNRHGMN
jgi:hypothetical protein